jgi:Sec-independent protein translocase protein TatA
LLDLPAGGTSPASRFVSLLLLALLLFLLFGGSRIAAAGKGLGQAVRHVKRAAAEPADEKPAEKPAMNAPELASKEPKLLPAKGESSAAQEDES